MTKTIYLALLAVLLSPMAANATLIDFEDLGAGDGTYIPQGYNGFEWLGGLGANSWVNYASAPIDAPCYAGINCSWSNGSTDLTLLADDTFSILSLWLYNQVDATVAFSGSLDGTEIFTSSIGIFANTWTEFTLNYTGIDSFSFDTVVDGGNLVVDNISFTVSVPEPGTLALLSLGLVVMAARRRKTV